jgi:hypothetical protein
MTDTEKRWTEIAKAQVLGRRIVAVRYMTEAEAKEYDWYNRPVVLVLDDGNKLIPSADDEGNNGGAIFTDKEPGVLPVMR